MPWIDDEDMPAPLQVSRMVVSLWVPQALHAAAELGLADVLSEGPLASGAVAERIGTHPDATDRLMRALRVLGILTEQGQSFALTPLGRCLTSRTAGSRRAWARLMGGREVWEAWGRLTDCVRTGRKAYGKEASAIDIFASADEGGGSEVFHQAMADGTGDVAPAIVGAVDVTGLRRIVDVGGGYGALLCSFLAANAGLEGAVFDLPHARRGALALFAERGVEERATFVAGSFFEESPPPADAYLLKSVIHDWDDEHSLRILARCRAAMGEGARLLLIEPVAGAPDQGPLADWFMAFSDLNMLVNTGGRERSEADYVRLLAAAKFEVLAVRDSGAFYHVFECVKT